MQRSAENWRRKKDVVFFTFEKTLKKDEKVVLEIVYHGTPINILSYSTIYWQKDKNNKPWICTSTQGVGPQHMMLCKMLLNDEADSCFIRVTVPKGLIAVANGKLDDVIEGSQKTTYNWSVKNSINIYNSSFNVGDYVKLEKIILM